MSPWMEEFIARCIEPIPDPGHRRRLSAELSDHLAALEGDLLDGGCPPEEARAAALAQMGDPAELAAGYLEGWNSRIRSPRYVGSCLFMGCVGTGLVYLLTFLFLGLCGAIPYDSWNAGQELLIALSGCVLCVLPFVFGGALMAAGLRWHPKGEGWLLAGLLLAWAGEKLAILWLSAWVYNLQLWELGPLLARISGGGDPTAPWFTLPYMLGGLALCPVLSRLLARPRRRSAGT